MSTYQHDDDGQNNDPRLLVTPQAKRDNITSTLATYLINNNYKLRYDVVKIMSDNMSLFEEFWVTYEDSIDLVGQSG